MSLAFILGLLVGVVLGTVFIEIMLNRINRRAVRFVEANQKDLESRK